MDSAPETDLIEIFEDGCYVALTHNQLNMQEVTDKVRSPAAGAIVIFAGKDFLSQKAEQRHTDDLRNYKR